jgi:hypothetical protein
MSMHYIASVSQAVNGSGLKTLTNIPQNFTHLQLRMYSRDLFSTTPAYTYMRFNGDTGNTANNHNIRGNGSTLFAEANAINLNYVITVPIPSANALTNAYGATIIDILDYTNTNKNKVARAFSGYDLNGSGNVGVYTGLWKNTAAITSIGIGSAYQEDAAFFRVDLYGISIASATGA